MIAEPFFPSPSRSPRRRPPRDAIRVRGASVIYPGADAPVHALKDVDLTIRQGEFISLIGPSGCGKTTLLRVIADLEPLSSGEMWVNDMSPQEARMARSYGYVFQAPALFPWRTVLANVMLPLQIQGRLPAQCEEIAREQLARVGLAGFEKKYPWQLSGGMHAAACPSPGRWASSPGC
jgi:NitT/TauT family transport system ATP-binding protein